MSLRPGRLIAAAAALSVLALVVIAPDAGDYSLHDVGNPDNPGQAIDAIVHLRLGHLADVQPLMGLVSLVGRAPFAALGDALGGPLSVYRFGAFACLWPLAVLALTLASSLFDISRVGAVAVVILLLFNPATIDALDAGHPEELLLAAAAVGGTWLALARQPGAGAVATGLAIGTKPFGALALLPSALAAGPRWRTVLATAAVVGSLFTLPLPLASPHTYLDGSRKLAEHTLVYAPSIWWPAGQERTLQFSAGDGVQTKKLRYMPGTLTRGSGAALAAVFALATGLLAVARRRRTLGTDALALLGAAFLARALFDPKNLEYYAAPCFVALAAWEVVARRRPPVLSLLAIAMDALTFHGGLGTGTGQWLAFVAWTVPLIVYLTTVSLRRA